MLVINFFASPCSGKTTLAALVFGALKVSGNGLSCEWAPEIAKEYVWEGRRDALSNRIHALGAQDLRISRLAGKADIVVTDGPVLLNLAYARLEGGWPGCYAETCIWAHRRHPSLNVFVERPPGMSYSRDGRNEDEEGAAAADREIRAVLRETGTELLTAFPTWEDAVRLAALAAKAATR